MHIYSLLPIHWSMIPIHNTLIRCTLIHCTHDAWTHLHPYIAPMIHCPSYMAHCRTIHSTMPLIHVTLPFTWYIANHTHSCTGSCTTPAHFTCTFHFSQFGFLRSTSLMHPAACLFNYFIHWLLIHCSLSICIALHSSALLPNCSLFICSLLICFFTHRLLTHL